MINNTTPANGPTNPQPTQGANPYARFAPSYNAVQINVDTPTVNAPPTYYYDYPQADGQPYYMPPGQTPPANNPKPSNVPPPQTEQPAQPQGTTPNAPVDQTQPAKPEQPAQPSGPDIAKVVANLADPDYEKQSLQMQEIAKIGFEDEGKAAPYVHEDVIRGLFDIIEKDSRGLAGPTEQQLILREKVAENDLAIYNAQQAGKDPNSVKLPHNLTPEEEQIANTITPLEQAERNKEEAIFTLAILQKTYADEIQKESGKVVGLAELPGAAVIVNELKSNQNPAIRLAAIDALRYVQKPEYRNELGQIYSIAQSDADDSVSAAAANALKSLG